MRSMKKGQKAFFYHSNTKEPGIAGVIEVRRIIKLLQSLSNVCYIAMVMM